MLSHLRLNSKGLVFQRRVSVIGVVARQRRELAVFLVEFVSVLNANLELDNCKSARTLIFSIK